MQIDETNRKIIALLQKDGRMPMADIARQVGLSRVAVRERVRQLMENDVIQDVVAIVNSEAVGYQVNAFLEIELEPSKIDQVCEGLVALPEVTIVYQMTGSTALHVHCYAKSTTDLAVFMAKRIYSIDGVQRVNSSILLKRFKSTLSIR